MVGSSPVAEELTSLLERGNAEAPCIGAPGLPPLRYAELRALFDATHRDLRRAGIGLGDSVALVMPNGPDAASAFVSIAASAIAAPLNPAYTAEELDFYLTDLQASALVVPRGFASPARAVAERRGILVFALEPTGKAAGDFRLVPESPPSREPKSEGIGTRSDIALVLHTSGTTARPKIVPLTQGNLCASAHNIGASLALRPDDVCLDVMPLFHIHGLVAAVLATLAAGASVSCPPGFDALKFFAWLEEVQPTWYTAVPTMHQAILSRAARNRSIVEKSRLRLVRSSSASLPRQVMQELEDTFRCPVIEAYGMTEAAHQMASNPLPPRARKPGTVGVPAGPEIAIMSADGALLPVRATGEVVIRGPNVTAGYLRNPDANARAFVDGWFRTGDEGQLDEDGYLHLTGRLKEMINRGGEKVSPLEVDDVLRAHPAIEQVVTFALPHDKLGEEVGAAVILRADASITERELREFAAARLAPFKVPRRIVFVTEIPKGPTGKVQRIGLAQRLGVHA